MKLTLIHMREKKAQEPSIKMMYTMAWMGSAAMC